jgi:hypothetical protein
MLPHLAYHYCCNAINVVTNIQPQTTTSFLINFLYNLLINLRMRHHQRHHQTLMEMMKVRMMVVGTRMMKSRRRSPGKLPRRLASNLLTGSKLIVIKLISQNCYIILIATIHPHNHCLRLQLHHHRCCKT